MISDEHLFMCLVATCISSLERSLFEPFLHFELGCFLVVENILDIKALSDTMCFRQCVEHLNTKKSYRSMTLEDLVYT